MNSQYFSKEQIKAGEMQKLLDFLMAEAYGAGDHYNDIHIKPEDCGAFVVEWAQVPWSHDWGGQFVLLKEGQVIMTEYIFPDNHTELCYDEEDFNERLEEFLKENPGWEKTSYGTWTNRIENERYQRELFSSNKDISDDLSMEQREQQ